MQVHHTLTRSLAYVGHDPEPVLFQSFGARHDRRGSQQLARELDIGLEVSGALHVHTRDHEDVNRGLRLDVPERDPAIVLGYDFRWNLAGGDPTEEAVGGHVASPLCARGGTPA
jgi:hypothetical protein